MKHKTQIVISVAPKVRVSRNRQMIGRGDRVALECIVSFLKIVLKIVLHCRGIKSYVGDDIHCCGGDYIDTKYCWFKWTVLFKFVFV